LPSETTRTLYTAAQEAVSIMAGSAPPELQGELTVLVGAYRQILDGLRRADFDVTRLPSDVTGTLATPSVRGAGDSVNAYTRAVCAPG